jgi:tetratricopeptide (TPR) repeat protein
MGKVLLSYALVLFFGSCHNNRIDKPNKASSLINKTKMDTILLVIKNNEKKQYINNTTKQIVKETEFNPLAIELNNKAIKMYSYIGDESISMHDSLLIDSAIVLLNKAIKIDNQYYLAYANKAMMLARCKLYTNAIETLDQIIKIRPNYAEGIANQGFIYEKTGDLNKANEKYKEAINAYLRRLSDPYIIIDGVSLQADIAFIFFFTEGKDKALQLIDTIISWNPDNKTAISMKGNIMTLNREEFISSF